VSAQPAGSVAASAVEHAVVETLAYADVFDWPLTVEEVHRFAPVRAGVAEVAAALSAQWRAGVVSAAGGERGLHTLRGREHLVAERRRRTAASQRLWPHAVRMARRVARIPWVRMVAVSGSLAVSAARTGDDVDVFVVARDGRLWLTRLLAIASGQVSVGRDGVAPPLCPNYMVTESALTLPDRDIYTAHELAQLVPLFGAQAYAALLDANAWYRDLLPNHPGFTGEIAPLPQRRSAPMLDGRIVSSLERWEMRRKVARLRCGDETRFDASTCKGHLDGHRQRFWTAYDARLRSLGLAAT
jgi:hypothetical protein